MCKESMTSFKDLDLLSTPLKGMNLTEASAGTGKTYAITALFVRLILEKDLGVNEILVVTFTEAATEELKDRIRKNLRSAIKAFKGEKLKDPFFADLPRRFKDSGIALRRLEEALRAFDQAAIFTIHGFCRRVLYENAFESGSLFDTELVADQEDLKAEIIYDFWRKHFYNASQLFVHYAISQNVTPGRFLSLVDSNIYRPYLKVIPKIKSVDTSFEESNYLKSLKKVRKAWKVSRAEVEDILFNSKALNRVKYKIKNISNLVKSMDDYVVYGVSRPVLFAGFERFTVTEINGAIKKNYSPHRHAFFDLCEELRKKHQELKHAFDKRILGLKAELFSYGRDELILRKDERNIQSFDDLLLRLHQALVKNSGDDLARAIRLKYKAALIDEFQDTDPVQYAIFEKIFGPDSSILFLIGDPKQAIYSFRSADIFTYMKAALQVRSRYSLGENWRSEPGLITAINTIFENTNNPFIYNMIQFKPAVPAAGKDFELLTTGDSHEPSFHLWYLDAYKEKGQEKPVTKKIARKQILIAVAGEISRLLHLSGVGLAFVGKRALSPGDIAVLVRKNSEARQMQQVLSVLDIPSVIHAGDDLFLTHEAMEAERLLCGIAEPNKDMLVRAALTTDMMGHKGEDLDFIMTDDLKWDAWLVKFNTYHELWNNRGFISMFRQLLMEENIMSRLMSFENGERRNTNVIHLSDALHQASLENKLGMIGLLKWLQERRDPAGSRSEEHQLRLESDENAVKLVTIHKSKGLEYPVVFCPFAWDGSRFRNSSQPFSFHDELKDMRLTLDLGSDSVDDNRLLAEKEQLAENLRLLYVALTRAKNRCYLVWGRINECETSALAYLFHQGESLQTNDVVSAVGKRFKNLTNEDILEELRLVVEKSGGTIKLSELPTETPKISFAAGAKDLRLKCRKFCGDIDRSWKISSFSSFMSGQHYGRGLPDHDAIALDGYYPEGDFKELLGEKEQSGIFAFPRGTKAGTFIHSVFEDLDFTQGNSLEMEQLVEEKLSGYGFDSTWRETICSMVRSVISVQLDVRRKMFSLSQIGRRDRINELGFYFPLKVVSSGDVKTVLANHIGVKTTVDEAEYLEKLTFSPSKGFMRGFIDMVFFCDGRYYLVDWKSNYLGPCVEDYNQKALAGAMKESFYEFQYLIYTIALSQYLKVRLSDYDYERHFGGVLYLFVRGIDSSRRENFGIYMARPSGDLIEELTEKLIGVYR